MLLSRSIQSKSFGLKAKFLLAVMALVFSFSSFAFFAPASVVDAAGVTFSVDKATVRLGEPILITGSGFLSGEKIAIWLSGPGGPKDVHDAGYLNAGPDGVFTSFPVGGGDTSANNITIGSGAGQWAVTVQGLNSGFTASATFEVLAPELALAGAHLSGTVYLVIYAGINWFPEERVSLWITAPDGSTAALEYTYADASGNIPDPTKIGFIFSGPVGIYGVTAQGAVSKHPVAVHFSIG
ncbi:MAG: hypothetical protein WCS37_15710 [Chloroflexota bacterium]|nr:hypothetical protein [Chloroflexota bacterium]